MEKFRHYFKTRKEFDRICPKPFEMNDLYFCESYIKDTEEIYTHGKFYCASLTDSDIDLICSKYYIVENSTSTSSTGSSSSSISTAEVYGIGDWDEEANISS